ncbi:MAG: hydrogenase maturation protease [Candidatus Aminicenantes bacterium]|nr:hydrogenase maturation protease [Candidatus Aminicenantes bacterium]
MNNLDKTNAVLIGIGNNLLTDDGIGPFLAEKIGQKLGIPYKSVTHLSLDMLDLIIDHHAVYILDSFRNHKIPVGEVVPFTLNDLEYQQDPTYSHGITIPIIFNIGQKLYSRMPENIRIYGINISDNQTVSESFSDEINYKLEGISTYLLKKIQSDAGGKI